jgi:Protein of unknown function (DUF3592)
MHNIVFILFIVIGICIVSCQLYLLSKAIKSKNWEIANGEIISSDIETCKTTSDSNNIFRPRVKYKYIISGKQHISGRIFFGDKVLTDFKGYTIKLINKYSVGSKVDVYFNPDDIEESVLERGVSSNSIILLIVGVSIILFGVILMKYYPQLAQMFGHAIGM